MKDSFVHNNKTQVIFLKFNQKYEIFIQIKKKRENIWGSLSIWLT